MIAIVLFVLIAVLPMGLGLMYAIYKWRESEQYLMWQEFSTGMFSSEAWAGVSASRAGGGMGSVARPADAGLVLAAMGPSTGDLERVPLTEEEFDGPPRPNHAVDDDGDELLVERSSLLVGGEGGESRSKKKGHSSGTWRMRRGADWNSDDAWK